MVKYHVFNHNATDVVELIVGGQEDVIYSER